MADADLKCNELDVEIGNYRDKCVEPVDPVGAEGILVDALEVVGEYLSGVGGGVGRAAPDLENTFDWGR